MLVKYAARDVFVPSTVGGGIRSVDDVSTLLRAGADKVAINTAGGATTGSYWRSCSKIRITMYGSFGRSQMPQQG